MASDTGAAARKLIIGVVVLVLILLAVDRGGDAVAERLAGDTIQSSQHLRQRPDVQVQGFPFLTQFVTGHYGEVVVTAHDVAVGKGPTNLRLSSVRVDLHDVRVARDFRTVTAQRATAMATVGYAQLAHMLGVHVGYAGSGRVKASRSVSIAGRTISASVTAAPRISDGMLSFGRTQIDDASGLGASVTGLMNRVFDVTVPLKGLPFRAHVRSLHVDSEGLQIGLAGTQLNYTS